MGERDLWFDRMRARYTLEHGLMLGGSIMLAGILIGALIVIEWIGHGFGRLAYENLAVLAATLIIVGIQIFFSSFLLSILGLRRTDQRGREVELMPTSPGRDQERLDVRPNKVRPLFDAGDAPLSRTPLS